LNEIGVEDATGEVPEFSPPAAGRPLRAAAP
jgi:hypothetical protein